jgi:oxygen-independent coproporphyrinogen-3 oxidase
LPASEYVSALIVDLKKTLTFTNNSPKLKSIYFGGGTPNLFPPDAFKTLLDSIHGECDFTDSIEITLEMNPGIDQQDDLERYLALGINRLSVGAQTFSKKILNNIGRLHNESQTIQLYNHARKTGFKNINLDLMFGLPGQTSSQFDRDLRQLTDLSPEHISFYELTIEMGTYFYLKKPNLPDHETAWRMYDKGKNVFEQTGYQQYEISAFSKPGFQCVHNLNYWLYGDFVAIGAGAHGKYTRPTGEIFRYEKKASPKRYMDSVINTKDHFFSIEKVNKRTLILDFLMNYLRTKNGFTEQELFHKTGIQFNTVSDLFVQAKSQGFLKKQHNQWSSTSKGHQFLNDLLLLFTVATPDKSTVDSR